MRPERAGEYAAPSQVAAIDGCDVNHPRMSDIRAYWYEFIAHPESLISNDVFAIVRTPWSPDPAGLDVVGMVRPLVRAPGCSTRWTVAASTGVCSMPLVKKMSEPIITTQRLNETRLCLRVEGIPRIHPPKCYQDLLRISTIYTRLSSFLSIERSFFGHKYAQSKIKREFRLFAFFHKHSIHSCKIRPKP